MSRKSWQEFFDSQEKIIEKVAAGLETDGAHHKQYYLYEIALLLGFTEDDLEDIGRGVRP